MHEKKPRSAAFNLIFTAPSLLLLFLVIPVVFIVSRFAKIRLGLLLTNDVMMWNNLCLLLVLTLRFGYYLSRLKKEMPYGPGERPSRGETALSRPADQVRSQLGAAGFRFDAGGGYGEKKNLAWVMATVLYGGLFLTFLTGTVDYLRQYSSVVLLGAGSPMQMRAGTGLTIEKGLLGFMFEMPMLQVKQQILPNKEWIHGATEIALLTNKDQKVLTGKTITWGGEPLRYGGFEYHMGRDLYDTILNITTVDKNYIEFNDGLKLQPDWKGDQKSPFTHIARLKGERGDWVVRWDPSRRLLKLEMSKDGVPVTEGELVFQKDIRKTIGSFNVEMNSLGHWSEIHVIRKRHLWLVMAAAVIAALGGLLRLFIRPQRVWLEETPAGCRVWSVGGEAGSVVKP